MCEFHSTVWRMLGQEIQMFHDPGNSHSDMIEKAGWRVNEPNRQVVIFEAEWNGEDDIPKLSKLIRNSGECGEALGKRIVRHYEMLKEAITEGTHLDGYFGDHKKYADVWSEAIKRGFIPDFSEIREFGGYVDVSERATLNVPQLTKCGYVDVREGATFSAPLLTKCESVDVREGATFNAPQLTECRYVYVSVRATFNAPLLTKCENVYILKGATFNAPQLKR